jgi:hypothetical protein
MVSGNSQFKEQRIIDADDGLGADGREINHYTMILRCTNWNYTCSLQVSWLILFVNPSVAT